MRTITCPRCNGAGERCSEVTERWHKCFTCSGTGTIASTCTRVRAAINDEPTPLAVSTLRDSDGEAVSL